MDASNTSPNVFLTHIRPAQGVASTQLEELMCRQTASFSIASRPYLAPELLCHRIMRGTDGQYVWEIVFEGLDLPVDDQASGEDLGDAISEEVRARLLGTGEVSSFMAYADLMPPPPSTTIAASGEAGTFADDDGLPGWEAYARDSGMPEAGGTLAEELLAEIQQNRAAVPAEPGLKRTGIGHIYAGSTDKAHLAYLRERLENCAAWANATDRRKIAAFRAFQAREGSTAAINTYDNQIVTWGTGWGGLGLLGKVMQRAVANAAVRDLFRGCGLRYRGKNVYDVVDLDAKRVVTGTKDALEVIRRSVPLLQTLIHAARAPETRDAVTDAQLMTFVETASNFTSADAVATQALFNFIAHLKHWAPAYVMRFKDLPGCIEWSLPQAGGASRSAERDRQLVVLTSRYFYGAPRHLKLGWIPDWRQFKSYWVHMKEDGLDCLSDPFIQASGPPADNPFTGSAAAPAARPAAPAAAARPAAEPTPAQPAAAALKNPPLAAQAQLQGIAGGKGVLRRGEKGAGVKALQEALMTLKYDVPGGADGAFGPGLEAAVKAFQKHEGLSIDGAVGAGTLKALDAVLGARSARG